MLAKSDYCSTLDVLEYYTTRTEYFCSLLDFFIFVGRCNKVRESARVGEGGGGGEEEGEGRRRVADP